MKKLLVMLSLVLAAVSCAYALTVDELIGKWESNSIKQDPSPEMPMGYSEKYVIEYKADNKMSLKNDGNISLGLGNGISVDMFLSGAGEGSYTVAGDSITLACTVESVKVNFSEDDVRVTGVEDAQMAENIRTDLYQNFNQGIDELKKQFAEPMVINSVLVTGNKMVGTIDGKIVTFKRKKK